MFFHAGESSRCLKGPMVPVLKTYPEMSVCISTPSSKLLYNHKNETSLVTQASAKPILKPFLHKCYHLKLHASVYTQTCTLCYVTDWYQIPLRTAAVFWIHCHPIKGIRNLKSFCSLQEHVNICNCLVNMIKG